MELAEIEKAFAGIRPLGDWALLERAEGEREKKGVLLPENAKTSQAKCRILAVSDWALEQVRPGEVVLAPVSCQKGPYEIGGRECWLAETADLLGVVEE